MYFEAFLFVFLSFFLLWVANKFLVKLFNIVSSFAVVASIFVVLYPPYQISVPTVIELNLGRFPLWAPPTADAIEEYLPKEFGSLFPRLVSDQNVSLLVNIDQVGLFSNLISIILIYCVVLTVFLTHKD